MHHKLAKSGAIVALICALGWSAGAAPTTKFASSGKVNSVRAETPAGDLETGKLSDSITQTIAITPEQEALLNSNTTIRAEMMVLGDHEFSFSDDPKYVPGAKSVKIKESINDDGLVGSISTSAKWGNGSLTVSIKVKATGPLAIKKTKGTRDFANTEFTTSFHQGAVTIFDAPVTCRIASQERSSMRISTDGSQSVSLSGMYKTGQILNN